MARLHVQIERENEHGLLRGLTLNSEVTIAITLLQVELIDRSFKIKHIQYHFYQLDEDIVVKPHEDGGGDESCAFSGNLIFLNHQQPIKLTVTDDFIDFCSEECLSFEFYGEKNNASETVEIARKRQVASVAEKWFEVKRSFEVFVEIHEMNERGCFIPVDIVANNSSATGGCYQLKQGQLRRIVVHGAVCGDGNLPFSIDSIDAVEIGSVKQSAAEVELDSYFEYDLQGLISDWQAALERRKAYLDDEITANKERDEVDLMQSKFELMEEFDLSVDPTINSALPGAQSTTKIKAGFEPHAPTIYLQHQIMDNALADEDSASFVSLSMLKQLETGSVFAWDSSVHESPLLNLPSDKTVYVILKMSCSLSHPFPCTLILRKRLALHIKSSSPPKFSIFRTRSTANISNIRSTALRFQVYTGVPYESHDLERRSRLAELAVNEVEHLSHYIMSLRNVTNILHIDKLRQELVRGGVKKRSKAALPSSYSVPNLAQKRNSLQNQLLQFNNSNMSSSHFSDLNFNQIINEGDVNAGNATIGSVTSSGYESTFHLDHAS